MPNPGAMSTLQLSMFSFVGKLMGVAMRAKHVLNLDLPSIVWKQIAGGETVKNDGASRRGDGKHLVIFDICHL